MKYGRRHYKISGIVVISKIRKALLLTQNNDNRNILRRPLYDGIYSMRNVVVGLSFLICLILLLNSFSLPSKESTIHKTHLVIGNGRIGNLYNL